MAWGISHKYKFIFIHIPKTAGTTICSALENSILGDICKQTGEIGEMHKSAMQVREKYQNEWKEYTKFAVVRNPFDRFVSAFFYRHLELRTWFDFEWKDRLSEGILPQLYWITDRNDYFKPTSDEERQDIHYGDIIVNNLLRYENLNTELEAILLKLGIKKDAKPIPHMRQTRQFGDDYKKFFDDKLRSIVTYLYRDDIKRLGYEW